MPDFTNMDSSLIASFWIYFVASFIFGVMLGALIVRLFFQREKSLMVDERKKHDTTVQELTATTEELNNVRNELENLKADVAKNTLYWKFQKAEKDHSGNASLYKFFHDQDKATE